MKPKLTILLSCWDRLNNPLGTVPKDVLQVKMPIFYNFIHSIWSDKQLSIVGLSSLGKDLDKENPDKDYMVQGPEKYGYIITTDGAKENDITTILKNVL